MMNKPAENGLTACVLDARFHATEPPIEVDVLYRPPGKQHAGKFFVKLVEHDG